MGNTTTKTASIITGSVSAPPAIKINIATPSYSSTYSGAYVKTLYKVLTTGPQNRVSYSFSAIDYADVVTARNYLISNFYFNKPDCSHILFIDDDMGFEASLIYEMLKLKKDFIGVIAPQRKVDLKKLHSLSNQSYSKALALSCEFIGIPKSVARNENFVEVSQCGGGILLLTRECIKIMLDKCPDIIDSKKFLRMSFGSEFTQFITPFNKIQLEDRELSEDFSFAYRWTNICNGKIYASILSNIQHTTEITLETKYGDLS
jgi:hypothetical protein